MALNFLTCKNVLRNEEKIPKKLFLRNQKKGKGYFEKYYTLQIDPMREILRREGQAEKTGIIMALHICRGHFKTYSSKGLFGKYQGTFWWPSHVRGEESKGKIKKDYEINILQPEAS
jgi:hypothetical protein